MTEDIGSLRVSIGLDGSDFNKSMASVERNVKALGQEMSILRAKGDEWGNSTEGLGAKQDTLTRLMDAQALKVKKLNEEYQKAVAEQGENSKAAETLAIKLNKAAAEYTRTEKELNEVNSSLGKQQADINKTSQKWDELSKSVDKTGDKMQEQGEKMKGIGEKLSVGLTAPLTAFGLAAGKSALEFDEAQGKLQAQLGLTKKEAEKLSDVAEDVWKNAFGESLAEVTENISTVKQTLKGLTDQEMKDFVQGAYTIKDAFGAEINETTRTASVLMKNFGVDGGKALDLITTGFQKGGNFSDELLDTLREYAPQFQGMGFTADEFLSILISGAEKGAFNLDKVGDAAKEAFLRIGDGSKGSRDALKDLGLDFQSVEKDINSGGDSAKKAFAAVVSAIATVEDPAKKAQVAVALMGSPIEDLGPEFQDFFADVNYDLGKVEGATKSAGDALYDNFGSRLQGELRNFQSSLEPAGEILLEIAEEWLPKLSEATQDAISWFRDLGPEGQETAVKIAGIAAAAGPAAFAVGTLASGVGDVLKAVGPVLPALGSGKGLLGVVSALSSPLGLAALGVVGLTGAVALGIDAYKKSNEVSLDMLEAKQKEIEKTDDLIKAYEDLDKANLLSNDEMLRFLDIQEELKNATTDEKIAGLKDEYNKLLDKSTLTNDEMDKFIQMNEDIVKIAPDTNLLISDQGKAFGANTDAIRAFNEEEAKRLQAGAYDEVLKSLESERSLRKEIRDNQEKMKDVELQRRDTSKEILSLATDVEEVDTRIKDLELQKQNAGSERLMQLDTEIRRETDVKIEKQAQLEEAKRLLERYNGIVAKAEEDISLAKEKISLGEEARHKYEEIILAQVGINSQKGKGLEALANEIVKLEEQRKKLIQLHEAGEITTAEYDEQNGKLNTQIDKIRGAQDELRIVNSIAQGTIYKDVIIRPSPNISDLNKQLGIPITKYVNVITSGGPVAAYASASSYCPNNIQLIGG